MISDAVNNSLVSLVTGYKIGSFNQNITSNLPMRIAILGEANSANQMGLSTEKTEITSANKAGQLYGFGSPIYHVARILFPLNSTGVAGIPVVVYPQVEGEDYAAKVILTTITGTATANATHTILVAGRRGIDGQMYNFTIATGDTGSDVATKISNVVASVLGCPVLGSTDGNEVALTSKWAGATANDLTIQILTNGNDAGLTYVVSNAQTAAGEPSIQDALNSFGNEWNTIVINTYNNSDAADALENFNGVPDAENPTGRFASTTMKPFFALTGDVSNDPTDFTDARDTQVTIVICPAPLSPAFPFEAAANVASLLALQAQNNPHTDTALKSYPDMPTPLDGNIGDMAQYVNRDAFVKKGCSTVDLVNGVYQIKDLVTTYHPEGDLNPLFRYVRNLVIDLNIFFGYYILENANLVGKTIVADSTFVSVGQCVKPKDWKQILANYFKDLEARALITDASFSIDSLVVGISSTNPDRFEVQFSYKRSSFGRIVSTTAQAGFNLGN